MLTSGYSPAKTAVAKRVEISRVMIFFILDGWVGFSLPVFGNNEFEIKNKT